MGNLNIDIYAIGFGIFLLLILAWLFFIRFKSKKNVSTDVFESFKLKNNQLNDFECKAVVDVRDQNTKKVNFVYTPKLKTLVLIGSKERLATIQRIYVEYIK